MNFSTLTPGYYLEHSSSNQYLLCQIHENDGEQLLISDIASISGFDPNTLSLADHDYYSYDDCSSCTYFPVPSSTPLSLADYQSLYPEFFL